MPSSVGPSNDPFDAQAERAPVADLGLDALAEVAGADDDVRDALLTQPVELPGDERAAVDVDERLRDGLGERTQTRGEATGQDGDRGRAGRPPRCCISHRGLRDDGRPFEVEAEPHLLQAGLAHGLAQPRLVLGVEHQEAAAARADQLAADRAVLHARGRTTRRCARCSCWPSACFLCSQCTFISSPNRGGRRPRALPCSGGRAP